MLVVRVIQSGPAVDEQLPGTFSWPSFVQACAPAFTPRLILGAGNISLWSSRRHLRSKRFCSFALRAIVEAEAFIHISVAVDGYILRLVRLTLCLGMHVEADYQCGPGGAGLEERRTRKQLQNTFSSLFDLLPHR